MSEFNAAEMAKRIRVKRVEHGMTQQQLDVEAGIGCGMVARYESAETIPGVDKLWRLAETLQVTPGWLMGQEAV